MSQPTESGRYLAKPIAWGVGKSKNGAVEFACDFSLTGFLNPRPEVNGWEDVTTDGMTIAGRFYPINKEGKLMPNCIKSLKESLGWSGTSLKELNDGDWSNCEVQLTLDWEEYEGKNRLKVQWLNPRDYAGNAIAKGDPQIVQSLDSQFGAQLRATNGNASAKPSVPNSAPSASDAAKGRAWTAFKAKYPEATKDEQQEGFRQKFKAYFPGRKPELATAGDWDKFTADGFDKPAPVAPFGDGVEFKEDDIPFDSAPVG